MVVVPIDSMKMVEGFKMFLLLKELEGLKGLEMLL